MRKTTIICAALVALVVAGCGGKEEAKPKPTTTTTSTTTTTLAPDKFAQQEYFKIVSELNPKIDQIDDKYPNNMSPDQFRRYCLEYQVLSQQYVDKLRAVEWPPQYQEAANDLIAKNGIEAGAYSECANTQGGVSSFTDVQASIRSARDELSKSASAFRALVGLPVARN